MIKKSILLLLTFIVSLSINAQQKVCESQKEDDLVDVNSISRCSISESKQADNKKPREFTVKISASRRYLKKRELIKKKAVSAIGMSTSGVSANNVDNTIEKEKIVKKSSNITNIENIKNKLSADEYKQALKFNQVDNIPNFKDCKKKNSKESNKCFNEQMIKHIQDHFHYPTNAIKESIEGEVWVLFIIDNQGYIKNIKTTGPHNGEALNDVAHNIVAQLPKFTPATKNGKNIAVKYGFPINFSLEE